jgi:hypothetical protein
MLRFLAIASVAAACGTPGEVFKDAAVDAPPDAEIDAPPVPPCTIGDVTQPIELEFGYRNPTTGDFVPVGNMMPLPITQSEQGGFTMRVGVRARNVHCNVQMATIALFDTCPGNKLLKLESRSPVVLMESAGWGVPLNLSSYMQLHACPYPDLPRHMEDVPYEIQLAIEDGGRTAQASLHVIPYCADSDEPTRALCECQCNKDYVLGGTCPPTSSGEPPVCDPS